MIYEWDDSIGLLWQTLEVTRLMLAGGKYKGMIASTIPEIKGALPLVEEGLVEEVRLFPRY